MSAAAGSRHPAWRDRGAGVAALAGGNGMISEPRKPGRSARSSSGFRPAAAPTVCAGSVTWGGGHAAHPVPVEVMHALQTLVRPQIAGDGAGAHAHNWPIGDRESLQQIYSLSRRFGVMRL